MDHWPHAATKESWGLSVSSQRKHCIIVRIKHPIWGGGNYFKQKPSVQ